MARGFATATKVAPLAAGEGRYLGFWRSTVSAHLHSLGFVLALANGFYLSQRAVSFESFVACLTYTIAACFVFSVSSTYHYLHDGFGLSEKKTEFFETLDHISIYAFIAATYTAITVHLINDSWKYGMLVFVWGVALSGITYTLIQKYLPRVLRSRLVYTSLFLMLGWTFVLRVEDYYLAASAKHIFWVLFGGVSYTVGALVYLFKSPDPWPKLFGYHEIWHLAVIIGWFGHAVLIVDLINQT